MITKFNTGNVPAASKSSSGSGWGVVIGITLVAAAAWGIYNFFIKKKDPEEQNQQ